MIPDMDRTHYEMLASVMEVIRTELTRRIKG